MRRSRLKQNRDERRGLNSTLSRTLVMNTETICLTLDDNY